MRIAVIGSGYVGLVAAACFAELGHNVVCFDNDSDKIDALNRGDVPMHERFLPELMARHTGTRLGFSHSLADAVRDSSIVVIAVSTPTDANGKTDLTNVEAVARAIAHHLTSHKIVVQKSTVPATTSRRLRNIMLAEGGRADLFDIVCNPEFLREGSAVTDFLYPHRIVLGTSSSSSEGIMRQLYRPLLSGLYAAGCDAVPQPDGVLTPPELIVTRPESAEIIKLAANAFLAMKISFINAVANICEGVRADVQQVCDGIGSDPRIGSEFLRAGIGYGGSCFPKDLAAFQSQAVEVGCDFRLLEEVWRINQDQRLRYVQKVREVLGTLEGKRLAILGLAYKGGTDDIRESPAIAITESLLKEECDIVAYDPAANPRARAHFGASSIAFAEDAYQAAANADALLVLTDWEEFASLDLSRLRRAMKLPNMFDGRNLFSPTQMLEHGFNYYGVGRAPQFAPPSEKSINTAA